MRKLIYFILFLVSSLSSRAQEDDLLKIYIDNYQYSEALSYMDKIPMTNKVLLQKAFCYEKLNNYRKSIDILLPLSVEYNTDKNIKLKLASCYQSLYDWTHSLRCYNDLIELDSTILYYKIQKADILFYLNRYDEALSQYKSLSDNYNLSNMIRRSALCFENMNMPDSAIVYYSKAYAIDSTDVSSIASLINLYIKSQNKENYSKAIELSDNYAQRDSVNKQINLLNGLSYYAADLYEEAAIRFEKCFVNGDTSLVVNRSLGISYYLLGENIKSYPYLLKAHEQDSINSNILYALAVVCNETSRPEQATKYFRSLLDKIIPADMTLYLYYKGLGIGQESLKLNNEAIASYKKAIEYAGDNQQMYLYFSLASIYDYELNNVTDALVYYKKYKNSLLTYVESIKQKESKSKNDDIEIQDTENKIENLNTHIERLVRQLKK